MRLPFQGTLVAVAVSAAAVVLTRDHAWSEAVQRYVHAQLAGPIGALWFLSTWLVVAELHALVHEGAHALTGLALGLPVTSVTAAGIRVYRENKRSTSWRVGVSEDDVSFLGGSTNVEHAPGGTLRLIATTAAGPAMSLLVTLCLFATVRAGGRSHVDPVRLALTIALIHCAWNAFHNSLPVRLSRREGSFFAKKTDGYLIRELWRLHRYLETHPAAAKLRAWAVSGKRLRDAPVTVDEAVESVPSDLAHHSEFLIFALIRCLDARAWPQAKRLIDRGVSSLDDLTDWARSDVLVQGTCLYALVEKDLPRARELVELAKEHEVGPRYARIAETSLLFADGKLADVKHELDQFVEDAKKARWPHLVLAGNEWSIDLMDPDRVEALKSMPEFTPREL